MRNPILVRMAFRNALRRPGQNLLILAGLDPQRASVFDELFDTEGAPLDLTALGPNEVYITSDGAEALRAGPGSALGVALGPGVLTPITVRGVVDGSYIRPEGTDVILMAALPSIA